jgi:hypothetical protein
MRKDSSIVRVEEHQVNYHLKQGYEFCPKEVWKTGVRDLPRTQPKEKRNKKRARKMAQLKK